ncbi:TetR/AcrR family transcriptional regulator [Paraburkholderia ginsengiterrae]|uniref:TetR family transcriptional regulator n=1 Tax=Paraburkholderia ginsengiterrae TaxID=1462993 RepID=A0A1A9N112_9BURK|nr:TetR/AcrR family transcriptional regulator [Paraburkholderia ginsengiterrae]OAJ54513.1 TetR family transcriptional regulator [Paraburkholderia ginsengiterrae]
MGIAERKNRQKQALRERILDAARRIVMREGFAALSMRKIADAIEYSPATLYLHFASRDEIARALCAEGYAQLLESFVPLVAVADPAERLKALGRAYVAFGVAHPETYRLIFMEDASYTGAALAGAASVPGDESGAAPAQGQAAQGEAAADNANGAPAGNGDESSAAALDMILAALEALKAVGRLPASTDSAVWAEAFWANLHGIVALHLTCPVFPAAPLDTVVGVALDAWLGTSPAAQPQDASAVAHKNRSAGASAGSPAGSGAEPADPPSNRKATKTAAKRHAEPVAETVADAVSEPAAAPKAASA